MIKVTDKLIREQDKLIKRFLLLNIIQISGEATLDNLDELAKLKKEIYKAIPSEYKQKYQD